MTRGKENASHSKAGKAETKYFSAHNLERDEKTGYLIYPKYEDGTNDLSNVRIGDWPEFPQSAAVARAEVIQRAKAVQLNEDATLTQVAMREDERRNPNFNASGMRNIRIQDLPETTLGESEYKEQILERAGEVDLDKTATEAEVTKAERAAGLKSPEETRTTKISGLPYTTPAQKSRADALLKRAEAVGLDGNASEADIKTAEAKK